MDVLQGKTKLTEFTSVLENPSYSSVKLVRTPEQLEIAIPSALNRKRWNYPLGLLAIGGYGMVLLSWMLIPLFWGINNIAITLSFLYGFLLISQIFFTARNRVLKIAILIATSWFSISASIVIADGRIYNFLKDYPSTEETTTLPLIVFAICLLILLIEIFWSDRLYQLIRYLLINTLLTIGTDRTKIILRRKVGFLVTQKLSLDLDKGLLDNRLGVLLTQEEKTWLKCQIEQFLNQS